MDNLHGKIALVTGASRGIGAGIAIALAKSGVDVAVNYRERSQDAEAVCAQIRNCGSRAIALQADVAQPAAIREMVADWLGAGRAITGEWEAVAWYGKNKDRMMLHPETRGKVEILLLYANRILSGRDWS